MMEDWSVREPSAAESGKFIGDVPGMDQTGVVETALVMKEVDEPDLVVSNEALGLNERDLTLVVVGPRSEVPRMGQAVTIELNGNQRRVRQVSEINLSILSPVEQCEAERRLNKKGRGRPRKKPLPEQGVANASLTDSDFIRRQQVILWEAQETIRLGRLIGAETVGNEEDIVNDIARIIEARGVRQ
ncbi:hypothetical protein V6N13_030872 [Hibiscus sabdariffa]